MPRRKPSKIRWSNQDQEQLNKKVRNYNAKIERLTKKSPQNTKVYPEKVSLRDLKKQDIYSRKDLNQIMKKLSSFTQRGSEEIITNKTGEKFTKFEMDTIKKENSLRNRRRTGERNRLGLDLKNDKRKIAQLNLQPKNMNIDKISRQSFKKANEQLERELLESSKLSQMQAYKDNYFKAIDKQLGSSGESLKKMLKDVDPMLIRDSLLNENLNTFIKISFVYSKETVNDRVDSIKSEWSRIIDT